MPRGSQPGERRGGRQRGTPNRKTRLKNAVFLAAAAEPNRSPLDFMLALMRDAQVPLDQRIDMAAATAPYVHARPKAPSRARTNPLDSSPLKSALVCAVQKQEDQCAAPDAIAEPASDGGSVLSPLKFLAGVMNDSEAPSKQRIRAARIAARYKHAHVLPDKMAAVDEYGFSISRTLAKAIADDWRRLEILEGGYPGGESASHVEEASQIYVRQAERDQFLHCPPGYSAERDLKRRSELIAKSRKGWKVLSMAEETELAHVVARITASEAAFNRTPEGRACRRIKELRGRRTMRTVEENKELEQLHKEFPSLGGYQPIVPIGELIKRIREAREQRIYELEKRRFVDKLTPAEVEELEELARRYPERVEKTRQLVRGATPAAAGD